RLGCRNLVEGNARLLWHHEGAHSLSPKRGVTRFHARKQQTTLSRRLAGSQLGKHWAVITAVLVVVLDHAHARDPPVLGRHDVVDGCADEGGKAGRPRAD